MIMGLMPYNFRLQASTMEDLNFLRLKNTSIKGNSNNYIFIYSNNQVTIMMLVSKSNKCIVSIEVGKKIYRK